MNTYKLKVGDTRPELVATLQRKKSESDLLSSATSTTAVLGASASATDDEYNGGVIQIVSGTGAGQVRYVKDYTGSTKTATMGEAWTTTPDGSSRYKITWTKRISDDLTSATVAFNFYERDADGEHTGDVVTKSGSVDDNTLKTVKYAPGASDWTDYEADTEFDVEVQVTHGSGAVETFPTEGYERMKLYADLD